MNTTTMNTKIETSLDNLEARLPTVPRQVLRLNRAVATAGIEAATRTTKAVCSASQTVLQRATTGARTVSGQAESVADRVQTTVVNGVREVTGQAKYQAAATVDAAGSEALRLVDTAIDAIEDRPEGPYEMWTKAELYERAQELDLDGRSTLSKTELIKALRSH